MRGLPMGLHRMSGHADAAFRDYVAAVRPPFVKFLNPGPGDEPLAAWCVSLGVQVIGRVYFEHQRLGAEGGRQIAEVVAHAHACPSIGYWELHNEAWHEGSEMRRYSDLSVDFMKALEAIGRKAVIGCFSTSRPDEGEWPNFRGALEYAYPRGHTLGLHEYSAPLVWWGVGPYQWDHTANRAYPAWPGPAPTPNIANEGWWMLKHRKAIRAIKEMGVEVPDILITECGNDDVWPRPSEHQAKGFREWAGQPEVQQYGDWVAQALWISQEYLLTGKIKGWVGFGFATEDPDWNSFDESQEPEVLGRLKATQAALVRGAAPAPPSTPLEVPRPCTAIREGETWWKHIAARVYGPGAVWADTSRLKNANPHAVLMAGSVIFVPGYRVVRDATAPIVDPTDPVVFACVAARAGDTMATLARRTGVTEAQMAQANPCLAGKPIEEGYSVLVPGYRVERG